MVLENGKNEDEHENLHSFGDVCGVSADCMFIRPLL